METEVFNFNKKNVRELTINEEPWFVAKDICDALGIENNRDAIVSLHPEDKGKASIDNCKKGVDNTYPLLSQDNEKKNAQEMNIVNESGLYSLIFKSRKPEAKAFQRWVTKEVLPSIRKTGSYKLEVEKTKQAKLAYDHGEYRAANAILGQNYSKLIFEKERGLMKTYKKQIKLPKIFRTVDYELFCKERGTDPFKVLGYEFLDNNIICYGFGKRNKYTDNIICTEKGLEFGFMNKEFNWANPIICGSEDTFKRLSNVVFQDCYDDDDFDYGDKLES